MLTLLPIAYWKRNTGTSNGRNFPFVCWANRDHPFAAAVMAQEIYESRFTTVRLILLAAVLVGIAAGVAYGVGRVPTVIDALAVVSFCLVVSALFTGLYPPWQREAELRGQAVECSVREGYYLILHATALEAATIQLTGYSQFKSWDYARIHTEILERDDIADRWVHRNRKLVKRILASIK